MPTKLATINWKKIALFTYTLAFLTLSCIINGNEAVESKVDEFDPNLQLEDYAGLKPSPPSDEWLLNCANSLANDPEIVKPFPEGKPKFYTLGDCIKVCNRCGNSLKGSIAALYGEASCPCNTNKNLRCDKANDPMNITKVQEIFEIVGKQEGFVKPDPKAVVLHLRLGDVVEDQEDDPGTLLLQGGTGDHPMNGFSGTHDIRSVNEVLDLMHEADRLTHRKNKVIIVGGSHKPDEYRKSRVYANCLARGLAKAGRHVEMYLDGGDADKDFYFMSHANMYVASTGGFSLLMGLLAKHGGAVKIWDFEEEYKAYNGPSKRKNDKKVNLGFTWAEGLDP